MKTVKNTISSLVQCNRRGNNVTYFIPVFLYLWGAVALLVVAMIFPFGHASVYSIDSLWLVIFVVYIFGFGYFVAKKAGVSGDG